MVNQKYLLKRTTLMLFSLFMIATVLFLLFRLVPGDPARVIAAGPVDPEISDRLAEQYGLDRPLYEQYLLWWYQLFQGNLGHSFYHNTPVTDVILDRLANTLSLMLTAYVGVFIIGIYVGIQLAWLRGKKIERLGVFLVLFARSMPVFWTALLLLYTFSFQLGWFPVGGLRSTDAVYTNQTEKFLSLDFLYHLVLPVASLMIYQSVLPVLLMRENMLEIVTSNYIDTAKAKGVPERRIAVWHAARSAALPVITAFALAIGFSVGGQVLVETVFSWPGLGLEMVNSSLRNDYPVAQATFLMLAALVIVMNFVADLAYEYLDPRVEMGVEQE